MVQDAPMSRGARIALALVLIAPTVFVAVYLFIALREKRQHVRTRVTLQRMHAIGTALDEAGVYPCVTGAGALPREVTSRLPPEALLDGWGRRITVLSSRRRYVLLSLGADGRREDRYDGESFTGYDGDVIFSNGTWVRHPAALSTAPELLPEAADAFAEAAGCGPAEPADGCEYYLYLPSRAGAVGAAGDLSRLGFTTEVRRAASGREWICRATKPLAACHEPVPLLWRVEKRHGGCLQCVLD